MTPKVCIYIYLTMFHCPNFENVHFDTSLAQLSNSYFYEVYEEAVEVNIIVTCIFILTLKNKNKATYSSDWI